MKPHHLDARIEQALALARCSPCPRRAIGAMAIDPARNQILVDGWNGAPRGGGRLCGGDVCERTARSIPSGTSTEVGCHHAEQNVVCNAAARGVALAGAWLIVTGEPCLSCAKLVHHAGITRVICVRGGYAGANGLDYLTAHGVEVEHRDGPADPRQAHNSDAKNHQESP